MNDSQTQNQSAASAAKVTVPFLTTADFDKTLDEAGDKPIFVDFYAEWCGPCKLAEPVIEKLAAEYKDKVILAKLDVDAEPEIAQKFGVMSIPTVLVFKNGDEIARKIGYPGEPGYRNILDTAIAKAA